MMLNSSDVSISVYSSGRGGFIASHEDGVRVSHTSGVSVACHSGRSQHQNKMICLRILEEYLATPPAEPGTAPPRTKTEALEDAFDQLRAAIADLPILSPSAITELRKTVPQYPTHNTSPRIISFEAWELIRGIVEDEE